MHLHRKTRTRARALAAVAAAVVALFGLPAPAQSAPARPAETKAVCDTPQKGQATCFALRRLDVGGALGIRPALTPAGYGPDDLRSAYRLPAGGGAGQTVAVVDAFDDPKAEADLAVYRAQFGLPACTSADGCFRKVDQRGGTNYPNRNSGWASEISLDLDMVSAAAPLAHIVLVEADSASFEDLAAAVDQAVAQGAQSVSNSYGSPYYFSAPGSGEDPSETTDLDAHYNHPGVAMVAASGDRGFGVAYPAASQYVTAVGGTSLVRDDSARGFAETVWHVDAPFLGGPGSGCSVYEPKPAFQKDAGCAMRTVADVAAVADPATGVAAYDTYGADGMGWEVFGGTSVGTSIIAGVYAVAGAPAPGTYPNAYPYAHREALNDVTSGDNGSCTPAYLCTAGPGYDGPTGLGTPAGPDAFAIGPHGSVRGTVTDSATGAPVGGATVRAGLSSTTTEAQGGYTLVVPIGTYGVTVDAYGYASASASGVTIADGATVTRDLALDPLPRSTISGTVTDGSGHGWPLYAKITVDGVPGGPVFTDPYTGHYSLTLPEGRTYTARLTANYPGYQPVDLSLPLGADDVHRDVSVPVDLADCTAPGYTTHYAGTRETFETTSTPAGWTVSNASTAAGWEFDDLKVRGNRTGGTGHFAFADSLSSGRFHDTVLTSPVTDLSGVDKPGISFDTEYLPYFGSSTADVEISVDGGTTWANAWHRDTEAMNGPAHVDIPLPDAAGAARVVARFHYVATSATWWQLDNVLLGRRSCDKVGGGLVVGRVTDANTGAGVNGATVSSVDVPAQTGTTAATPSDPNVGDGFYWMFSSVTGSRAFTATRRAYSTVRHTLDVAAEGTTRDDFTLPAGRVAASPATISKTVDWATSTTAKLTLTNTGTAPATVSIADQPGSFQLLTRGGAAPQVVKTKVTALSLAAAAKQAHPAAAAPADVNPSAAPWTSIADYPVRIDDNLVDVFGGKVYSVYGYDGDATLADLYAYDPDTGAWTKLARAADIRDAPAGGFIGDRLYATGGWGGDGFPDPKTEAYDPDTNTWTTVAANPQPLAGAGSATLKGRLYVIGGCTKTSCGRTNVQVYDPGSDMWTTAADYPEPISWESCGALAGKLYCAGGTTDATPVAHTYVYDPGTNEWTPRASMPADLWGSAHAAANGRLLVSGGVTENGEAVTNQGYAYDPVANAWASLPNSNAAVYRGGSACGLYRIGGTPGGLLPPPVRQSEVLPGFTDCAAVADVPWLSESTNRVTIKPGGHATVTLTLNASDASITQPGAHTASLVLTGDTPYPTPPVDVTMVVKPAKTWGKIAGTVTGTNGKPLAGTTVQIETWASSYTLKTDKNGQYGLWLDVRNNPLQVIAAKEGYQPQAKTVKITKGTTTTVDFTLKPVP
jgi:N-acetylneuraminic acid mutarotase